MARMKEGENPRSVSLNSIDLWVQIHDLKPGFMSENIIKEVGNYIGKFVESCNTNFKEVLHDYMRVRVSITLSKPLKRRMKINKDGDDWLWITFKYENVPTFCFICGFMGHSDKFCSRLFDAPENEIARPYGIWMRVPFRRQVKPIGAKWLRSGGEEIPWSSGEGGEMMSSGVDGNNQDPKFTPQTVNAGVDGGGMGGKIQNISKMVKSMIRGDHVTETTNQGSKLVIIDTKKGEQMMVWAIIVGWA